MNNNILLELVQTVRGAWSPGLVGVSDGVMSVIADYSHPSPALLSGYSLQIQQNKFLKLAPVHCAPSQDEDLVKHKNEDNLYRGIVACLSKFGYKLGMDVNFDTESRIFFFIKYGDANKEIKLPNMLGAGLGEKESLAIYRPLLKRQQSSFLRSFRNKPNVSRLRREVQASLRRKAVRVSSGSGAVLSWWQQSSIDSNNSEDK